MSKRFIGIDEQNEWEDETFGYYCEDTEDNRQGLQRLFQHLAELYARDCELELAETEDFTLNLEGLTLDEAVVGNKAADNGYMPRYNRIEEPIDWNEVCKFTHIDQNPLYKGSGLVFRKWKGA